ncbi:hypothetical protein RIF29_27995 [Crotalaria pallida]|uniref:MYB transcription factor n=1 Tax=Crotalaria pallida TaxID=3830 RepID=A0AAN9ER49_CROPI
MGNQKQKWTADEEDALHRGVQKYGAGKWKNILKDPDFAPFLTSRSNIDLKDKWRNLNVSNGQGGTKEKSRTPKPKAMASSSASTAPASASVPAAAAAPAPIPAAVAATPQSVVSTPRSKIADDHSMAEAEDSKNPPRYNAMVFEALSMINDANGSDISAIASFIEQKHKVPPNFRRALSTRLRRLVSQGKIEKVENGFKIKEETPSDAISPVAPQPNEAYPQQYPTYNFMSYSEAMQEAIETAAYRIAEAQNKEYLASEAFKEVEKLTQMAEDNESVIQMLTEMYEQSTETSS